MIRSVFYFLLLFGFTMGNAQVESYTATYVETNTVLDFIKNSKEHSIMLQIIEATDMSARLREVGPMTLFAPTDAAFEKLPKRTVNTLFLPENKEKLTSIMQYHVLNGSVNTINMSRKISENNGKAIYETLNGNSIVVFFKQGIITIEAFKGKRSFIETPDKKQNNGYIHVVDTVFYPN